MVNWQNISQEKTIETFQGDFPGESSRQIPGEILSGIPEKISTRVPVPGQIPDEIAR